ncbi:DUF1496 domain-containing protein [Rahnella sp. SAP-1]|jgi:hypothetical protein|uniref:DUF1496 domain-containing protein n=1 Tax=Rouxiella aceris TaxID=2703884 RepID=A0A848MIF2_9GAMM|nr:DUF1496 domain-containing protein [Rouxiella aceris]NMP26752.1 DUF1496 domain-containing protein [Rouxiella aceris]
MNKYLSGLLLGLCCLSANVLAEHSGSNVDVVVPLPPQAWGAGTGDNSSAPPCHRCCIYNNKSYSEGSVVTAQDIVLQCVRDKQVVGTNDLIWQRLEK